MQIVELSESWHQNNPEAVIGLLEISGVDNSSSFPAIRTLQREAEDRIRQQFQGYTRQDFNQVPVFAAYRRYYKQFRKTYHVQLQVESIALKKKKLPRVSPLVDANFLAEIESFVLTAGHDIDKLQGQVWMDISREGDQITQMNGITREIRPGDMIMRDAAGVCCSIIYGQDNRSPISKKTTRALYVVYGPPDVPPANIEMQLRLVEGYLRLAFPPLKVEQRRFLTASD